MVILIVLLGFCLVEGAFKVEALSRGRAGLRGSQADKVPHGMWVCWGLAAAWPVSREGDQRPCSRRHAERKAQGPRVRRQDGQAAAARGRSGHGERGLHS